MHPGFGRGVGAQTQEANLLLPPANEVWGKVIFFTPVCHFVHRGGGVSGPGGCACSWGVSGPGGVCSWREGGCLLPEGLVLGGCLLPGGVCSWGVGSGCVCLVQGVVPGGDPPGWLLLWAVRILLECILV